MESEDVASQQAGAETGLPDDFPHRIATKIVGTLERERDSEVAMQNVATLILRHLRAPDRLRLFIDTMEVLIDDDEAKRYAALSYVAIAANAEANPDHAQYLDGLLDVLIDDHIHIVKPEVALEENPKKRFSAYARQLGETFSQMIDINSDFYEVISTIFSSLIRKEMAREQAAKEEKGTGGRRYAVSRDAPRAVKKLFDETVDYIHGRGEFRSDSLNQQNPNEYMAILADRMRGTRRYVIQDIINRQALAKKKEMEKELSERLANAEDIILAKDSFKKAINLFWTEKLYNFKYLSVEKVRVTVQVTAIVLGIVFFLFAYLGIYGMIWWEGVFVAAGMYVYARVLCSRNAFRRFFPDDVSKELEVVVGSFTPTMRRMSKEQMDALLIRQVRDAENLELLPILPEFVKYLFAVMPDRKSAIITLDELSEVMENLELDISRTIRASAARNP